MLPFIWQDIQIKKKNSKGNFKMIFHVIAENNSYKQSIFEDILNQNQKLSSYCDIAMQISTQIA